MIYCTDIFPEQPNIYRASSFDFHYRRVSLRPDTPSLLLHLLRVKILQLVYSEDVAVVMGHRKYEQVYSHELCPQPFDGLPFLIAMISRGG